MKIERALHLLFEGNLYNNMGYLNKQGYKALKALEGVELTVACHSTKDGKILKARSGDYVTYKDTYLLDNLAREIYLLESTRRWKEQKETEEQTNEIN